MGIGYSSFKHDNVVTGTPTIYDYVEVKRNIYDDDAIVNFFDFDTQVFQGFENGNDNTVFKVKLNPEDLVIQIPYEQIDLSGTDNTIFTEIDLTSPHTDDVVATETAATTNSESKKKRKKKKNKKLK
jgi:hypothetical protein